MTVIQMPTETEEAVIATVDIRIIEQIKQAAFAAGAASRDSEIEALRADAARYRWLRDHVIFGYPSSEGSSNKAAYLVVTGYGYRERKNLTDQAVDAASAAEGEAP